MSDFDFLNILAIDTSSSDLKLGLMFGGDRMVKSSNRVEKSHGQQIIKRIGELFQSAGLQTTDLHALVVCTGPGSFTGLRIGLAAAKGMAVALDIPLVGVPLFEIAAYKLRNIKELVYVVLAFNREECFVAPVRQGEVKKEDIALVPYRDLAKVVGDNRIAGMGVDVKALVPEAGSVDMSERLRYDATELLDIGRMKLEEGIRDDIAQLEPLYLRKSQAELRFEQRQRKKEQ